VKKPDAKNTEKKISKLRLPAMNCKMGDRGYLVTAMTFGELARRVVDDVRLIHKSDKLAQWIQRVLKRDHAKKIANYLQSEKSRFFNALVIGVYGGDPLWSELTVSDHNDELTEDEENRLNSTIGVLILTGKEILFPIDGQHRIAGIKQAVADNPDLAGEEVTTILVGHAKTDLGMQRTRRLFVTLNQRAKKVSDADIVALDEDNGLAVVTRRIIDEGVLFPKPDLVCMSGSVAIPEGKPKAITSILGLYQILKGLYPKSKGHEPAYSAIMRSRPTDDELDEIHTLAIRYWRALIDTVPEYKRVIKTGSKEAGFYRSGGQNHLLFRPVGQLAMAKATECLISQGEELEYAVRALIAGNKMSLLDRDWHSILWNPDTKKMMNEGVVAETLLLNGAGKKARTSEAQQRLDAIRKERDKK
jgi:DNA sulfur modification protein DndB